jgi:hypothetical protein
MAKQQAIKIIRLMIRIEEMKRMTEIKIPKIP